MEFPTTDSNLCKAEMQDPNAGPDHGGSGWRHWSREDWKAATPGANSTKRGQKRSLNVQMNFRDQEAAGSSPTTPTIFLERKTYNLRFSFFLYNFLSSFTFADF